MELQLLFTYQRHEILSQEMKLILETILPIIPSIPISKAQNYPLDDLHNSRTLRNTFLIVCEKQPPTK